MKRWFLLAALVATTASAHHGWSEYKADKPLTLSGTIEETGYLQPHGFVRLKTADKTWLVVLASFGYSSGADFNAGLPKSRLPEALTFTFV